MDNSTILKAVSGIAITAVLLVCPQASFAEDDLYCTALFVCDEQGRVLPKYSDGKCREIYEKQCAQSQVNKLNEKLYSCYDESAAKEKKLERKIRRLKKALRKAKAS